MKILITGATGLVGRALGRHLALAGHEIIVVSRRNAVDLPYPHILIKGDLSDSAIPQLAEMGIQAIYHLMGESVAQRWTSSVKRKLRQSRIQSTENLKSSLGSSWPQVSVFIGASAIGYYGNAGEKVLNETSTIGRGFLAELCRDWESAQLELRDRNPEMRIVLFRTGLVLAQEGGALQKMLPAFLAHVGGSIGNGEQWQSWIHLNDLVKFYSTALTNNNFVGIFNAVSPEPVKNKKFTMELEKTLGVVAITPIPTHALELLVGEMSEILLDSQRVIPQRALEIGFVFEYSHIGSALQDLVGYYRWGERELIREHYIESPLTEVFRRFSNQRKTIGDLREYSIKLGGLSFKFQSVVEEIDEPKTFIESQLKGPYRRWKRTVQMCPLKNGVWVRECIRYQYPMSWVANWVGGPQLVENHLKQAIL